MGVKEFYPANTIVFGKKREIWGGNKAKNFIATFKSAGNEPYDMYCQSYRSMDTCPRCRLNPICQSKVAPLDAEVAQLILKNP